MIAGVLTIYPGSSSVLTLRKVILIVSIIFASFFAFWAFIGAFPALFLNANIDVDNDYNKNRWLRVTQGFCAIFEIILARVTLSQRTSDQEGNVIATPQPVLAQPNLPIYQPVVQTGYQPVYQHGVQPGVQIGVQPGVQPGVQLLLQLIPDNQLIGRIQVCDQEHKNIPFVYNLMIHVIFFFMLPIKTTLFT